MESTAQPRKKLKAQHRNNKDNTKHERYWKNTHIGYLFKEGFQRTSLQGFLLIPGLREDHRRNRGNLSSPGILRATARYLLALPRRQRTPVSVHPGLDANLPGISRIPGKSDKLQAQSAPRICAVPWRTDSAE